MQRKKYNIIIRILDRQWSTIIFFFFFRNEKCDIYLFVLDGRTSVCNLRNKGTDVDKKWIVFMPFQNRPVRLQPFKSHSI